MLEINPVGGLPLDSLAKSGFPWLHMQDSLAKKCLPPYIIKAWLVRGKLRIPGKAWTISMVLFIVKCGLKVGNSFLYIFFSFSLFYRDSTNVWLLMFVPLLQYSLTDLFLCASETKKTTTTRRVSIFSDDTETFLKCGKHELTPSSKAAPQPRKKR